MQLKRIKLVNFRNYKEAEVGVKRRVVILVGDNAQGKTNFLEAIYLLAITKSFRLRSDLDLLGSENDFARVEAEFEGSQGSSKIEIVIKSLKGVQKYQKIIKLNKNLLPARAVLGAFLAVLFCPEDINLIKTVPGGRRRLLDIIGCQISPDYCEKLVEYNKIVRNRNQVLARIKQGIGKKEELIFWNNELVNKGSFIIKFRQEMIETLDGLARGHYSQISSRKPSKNKALGLRYASSFHLNPDLDEEALRLRFRSELMQKQESEIHRQQTIIGPHRDDFHFLLGPRNIIFRGSRGEFRSVVLALKLAEADFLEQNLKERPVLLLDDVFSELDSERKKSVAGLIPKQQAFITTTDLNDIGADLKRRALVFKIEAGEIKQ